MREYMRRKRAAASGRPAQPERAARGAEAAEPLKARIRELERSLPANAARMPNPQRRRLILTAKSPASRTRTKNSEIKTES
jgi:hypothetical protein